MRRVTALGATLALLVAPVLVRLLKAQAPSAPPPPPPTYTLTDLGPMTVSAIDSQNVKAGPTALNGNAQVAGFRTNASFNSQFIAFLWDKGTYTDLGTGGGATSFAYGINSTGQIVGASNFVASSNFPGDLTGNSARAFLWQSGIMNNLNPDPNSSSRAYAINAGGDVAGFIATGAPFPVIWRKAATIGASPNGAVRSNNAVTITTTSAHNFAAGDSATIVGVSDVSFNGLFTIASVPTTTTFTYAQSGADATSGSGAAYRESMLPSLPCLLVSCQGEALAINDLGQAAGWGVGGNVNAARPVMWDTNGQPTDLIPNPGYYTEANGINNGGVVVGYYQPGQVSNTPIHAFSWQGGTLTDLGAVGNDTNSGAWGINSKGDIVGISGTNASPILAGSGGGGRAFLYTGGIMHDLTSLLVSGTNWSLDAAYGINDSGQIVGTGRAPDLTEHGYLLTPVVTPTTTTVSSSVNPSVFGQQVSFTATVSSTASSALTPTSSVTFNDGASVLGTVALSSGTAVFNTATLAPGTHSISASYGGDNNFGSSTSSAVNQPVNQAATSTALAASPNPANSAQTVTFTATVTVVAPGAGTPTGTVTFRDGATALGTVVVNSAGNATFSTSSLALGSHSIMAAYGGDTNFAGSSSSSVNQVISRPATSTAFAASPNPANLGQTVTFTATITPAAPGVGTPTGTVTFLDGATTLGVGVLSPLGTATLSTSSLAAGSHTVTASYGGDATFAGSTSTGVTVTVQGPVQIMVNETVHVTDVESFPDAFDPEKITVTDQVMIQVLNTTTTSISAGAVVYSTPASVTVSVSSSTAAVTGNVALSVDGGAATTLLLTSGSATFNLGVLQAGGHSLSANFVAQGNFLASSAQGTLVVSKASPTITWANTAPITYGTLLSTTQLNASASVAGSFTYSPALGALLNAGSQTLSTTFTPTDTANYRMATTTVTLVVNKAPTTITWATPASIFYPIALSGVQLDATASVPGSLVYSPPAGTVLSAGPQTLSVAFTPTDSTNYTTATATVSITVIPPVQIVDNETIAVTDAASFPDVFDAEKITVTDQVSIQVLNTTTTSISVTGGAVYGTPASVMVSVGSSSATVAGNVSLSVDGGAATTLLLTSGSATFNLGILKAGNHSLVANFPAQANFAGSSGQATLVINQATPSITWASPAPVTFGTPLTSTQLNATASVPGSFAYSPGGGTLLGGGTQTLSATFTPTDSVDYATTTATATLVVNKATPTITWANPASIPYGTALSATQLNAASLVAGSFAYTPASGTVLSAGTHILSATFSPADSADYTTATATVTITVLNTTVGTNVSVTPVDTTTGSTPVTLKFTNVTTAGVTGLTSGPNGAPPPPGFEVPAPIVYYDISTTAAFTGTVQVCFHYANLIFFGSTAPHVFHLEGGVWVDRTTTIDTVNLVVCGVVPSLSPFALFAPKPVLTITANNASRQFGAADPSFSVSYSGFVGMDTPALLSGTLSCSSTDTVTSPVGAYAINCSGLSSPNYVVRYAAGALTVTPASTTTSVSVSPSPVKYSDYTALTATVSPTSAGGQTLTGNVQFSLNGGTVGSAVPINSSGVATLSQVQVNLSAGSYPVKAVLTSANANFAGSTGTTTQNVAQENTFILYSGDTIAQVGTTLNLRATVWDSAAAGYPGVNPESGPTATIGDITKMWIALDIYPAGGCGSGTPSTVYAQVALTGAAGIGTATTTLNSSSEVSYCVISRLVAGNAGGTNQFYTAPNAETVGVDFYVNSGQFANGGGWVNDPTGSHGNFGFNARYNSTGSPKGQVVYIYRALYNGVLADFIIKSNALSALQFSSTTYPISSTLQGKVNVQVNRASDGLALFSAGNYTFSATLTDSGQNGTTGKQFSLIVYDASGVPYHSVPAGTSLQGGNVVVHSQ